ncbi:12203_t:CDS:2 [Dentiscutata erythropus]|uniref:12203_t:CDS:1 n=1 Tax=Dentiscutata erythropus TaxID=1348616 RepID=A0A9N9HRN1_9GLOM|nr:12203_t:CDS:2 [Dentiscutata erythropus]
MVLKPSNIFSAEHHVASLKYPLNSKMQQLNMAPVIQPSSIPTVRQSTINNCIEPEVDCTDDSLHEDESQLTPDSPKSGILPHFEYVSYDRVQDIYEQRKGHFYFIPEGFKPVLVPNDSKVPAVPNLFENSKPVPYEPNVPRMLPDSDARLSSSDLPCRVAGSKKENSAIDKKPSIPSNAFILYHQDISNDDISKEIGMWSKDSLKQQQRRRQQRRGFYATRVCTNCRKKHAKCSGETTCERCTLRNLECTFIDSSKKRGPKTNGKHLEQVYALNGLENNFEGTSMLSSVILNPMQGHASIPSSPSGYPQQQLENIFEFTFHCDSYEEPNSHAFQEASSFSYQSWTNTEYVMQSNNLIDNTFNNNTIFLYDNLFFDNNHMPSFHY